MSRSPGFLNLARLLAVISVPVVTVAPSLHQPAFAQKKKGKVSDQPSQSLERGLKLYEDKEYYLSTIELFKVTEGESGDNDANKMKAEFVIGKALYNMELYSASMTYFDKIVQKGAAHPHFNETLRWLASLSTKLPDSSAVIDKVGKYQKAELDQPALEKVRDQLYFLLGKFHYNKSQFNQAVALFKGVPPESEFYAQAKLFEGATYVREFKGKEAAEAFKEVLRTAASSSDPKIKQYEDLANLSLARTFYSTRQYELATKYFDRVSPESYDWPNSLFESSWANFMLKEKGYSKAMGGIHTLQAPYFENFVKPESVAEAMTVKATIYYYNCLFDRARETVDEFNGIYQDLATQLQALASKTKGSDEFFDLAKKIRNGQSDLPPEVAKAAKAVLSDRSLSKKFEYVDDLDRELAVHEKSDATWKNTAVANAVLTDLTLQRSLVVNEAGELSRQRITRLVGELIQLIKRVIKIEYQILEGQKGVLQQEVNTETQVGGGSKVTEISNIRVDDEHELWPFTGEWWRDELGYYRSRILNKCEKTQPEGAPQTGAPAEAGKDAASKDGAAGTNPGEAK